MGSRLFVGNLPFSIDDASLRRLFEDSGRQVEEVAIITDRMTQRPRGFAFVTMASDDDARSAMTALDGSELGGRSLVVKEAEPRGSRPRPAGDPGMGGGFPPFDAGHGFARDFGGGGGGGSRRKRRTKRML